MTAPLETLAENVRLLRAKAGLSQTELAEKAGCHVNTIGMIERGINSPSWLVVHQIAAALGTTVWALGRSKTDAKQT